MQKMITILGPTASGKTPLAAAVARAVGGEIISADSRQVYKRMDIGTGKDLEDYGDVPYHLIDIAEPGTKYNLFQYQQDFFDVYRQIADSGKVPILCGGTGLYIEAVLKGYQLSPVPQNQALRDRLEGKSLEELTGMLRELKARTGSNMHNTTDVDSAQRAIRAIEIEEYNLLHPQPSSAPLLSPLGGKTGGGGESSPLGGKTGGGGESSPQGGTGGGLWGQGLPIDSLIVGVSIGREERRQKITQRLKDRLEHGMVEEVRSLLSEGIPAEDLLYYGLEYKYVTEYVLGRTTYDEMFSRLEIAIHQFAKRQMTWFRGMERRGFTIHWIDALLPMEEKVAQILRLDNFTIGQLDNFTIGQLH